MFLEINKREKRDDMVEGLMEYLDFSENEADMTFEAAWDEYERMKKVRDDRREAEVKLYEAIEITIRATAEMKKYGPLKEKLMRL